MDGEAGWWTTGGKIGLTPLAVVMGVGRQQHHMVETYSSVGLVMALYVVSVVSFCCPHVVDASALGICIVLRVLCEFRVQSEC